jgi:hypothetical protein
MEHTFEERVAKVGQRRGQFTWLGEVFQFILVNM